ncbi:MAG: cobalamin biosynthesis protein CbiG [Proteobacteria bacterium]|nr:cobalamin biosynthesis protein CbiG [Pseudomonadota bacterium]
MLFDSYVMVDWSGANAPRTGRDSIWIAVLNRTHGATCSRTRMAHLVNPPTRSAATHWLGDCLARLCDKGNRILVGFDFPFGFPSGTASALNLPGTPWRHLWQALSDGIDDDRLNRNTRFDLAESLNRKISGEAFPFWGNVREEHRDFLVRRRRRPHGATDLAERRLAELRVPRTQPVWKLAGAGSVGSQALTGIPRVWSLRRDPRLAMQTLIWPFETGLNYEPRAQIILAEIYPSLSPAGIPAAEFPKKPKDAAQISATVRHFAKLDKTAALESFFHGDPSLTQMQKAAVEAEEAWILGVSGVLEK